MPDGSWMNNFYDASGMRIAAVENSIRSDFTLDGGNVITENSNGKDVRYIRGLGLIANRENQGEYAYYLHNGHGDVVNLVNGTGDILNSYNYDAFGNEETYTETVANRFMYAGEQFDKVTGQYYLRARYYAPQVGRFITEDSYRGDPSSPLSLNLYSYCRNNPILYTDPSGHIYIIGWSYGRHDVEEYEQYIANNRKENISVDGSTDDWDDTIWNDFTKRSSFARAAYTKKQELLNMGVPESDIDVQRIDGEDDLEETWDMWAGYNLIEGLDFYSHGYSGGAEVYGGSGDFWDNNKKLNWDSTLRELKIKGKKVGYISSPYTVFYGCNTANGDFAQNYANIQGVTTYAQTDYANFSHTRTNRTWIDTHGTSLDVYLLSFESLWNLWNSDGLGKKFVQSKCE